MKKIITILTGFIFLLACNTGTDNANDERGQPSHQEHEKAATELSLDSGKKWKSDTATRENIRRLQTLSEQFANESNKDLAGYKTLGNSLQEGLNKLIKECKMSGPEHDALHRWLEPFIVSVRELNKANDTTDAERKYKDIREELEVYSHYFE